jgi:hypothetical protein
MTSVETTLGRLQDDEEGGFVAFAVGSAVLLIQVCAIIPGLLPSLLLTLPLVLPVVVLGLVAAFLVGVPLGIWRLVVLAWRSVRRSFGTSRRACLEC